jgi:hypothetical protein
VFPAAPRNVLVLNPYEFGAWDIRWDSPVDLPGNENFVVLGVDIYRSFDGIEGPFTKVNIDPIATQHYRDRLGYRMVTEDVTTRFVSRGDDSLGSWTFTVGRRMQVPGSVGPTFLRDPQEVTVTANGEPCVVAKVEGQNRRVVLQAVPEFDAVAMQNIPVKLPQPGETVLCTYPILDNNSSPILSRRLFYKVVTVTTEGTTPLENAPVVSAYQMEAQDYIWKEACRRNDWLLQQGGNRVKVFVRKWAGERCPSYDPTHASSSRLCDVCYGTGFVGGYDGPYDMLIAPPNNEWQMAHQPTGFKNTKTYQSWSMVFGNPYLAPRDLVLFPNGERYLVGGVTFTDHRGVMLQQQFNLSLLDTNDPLYTLKAHRPDEPPYPGTGGWNTGGGPDQPSGPNTDPFPVTDHPGIGDEREERGTTPTFGAIEY